MLLLASLRDFCSSPQFFDSFTLADLSLSALKRCSLQKLLSVENSFSKEITALSRFTNSSLSSDIFLRNDFLKFSS